MTRYEPIVHRMTERSRPALLAHFLALPESDRHLRFGIALADEAITHYVERIDFDADAVFAVLDDELAVIGAAHLAVQPGSAELGVSVSPGHRGLGIGTALFSRAEQHARNRFVSQLYMHCLAQNAAMMKIARRAGMRIVVEAGDADAHLLLASPTPASMAEELIRQRVALFDYGMKTQAATLRHAGDAALAAMRAIADAAADAASEAAAVVAAEAASVAATGIEPSPATSVCEPPARVQPGGG